jgi:hypothetical protein
VGITISNHGWGRANTPGVKIIGGGGSGVKAVAVVSNGMVIAVTVLEAGSGYTNTPSIIIAPPPATALWPNNATQAMGLDLGSLSPYDNYQLEFIPALGGAWSNLGSTFTPPSATSTQYVNVSGSAGFFRVSYVP